MTAPEFASSSKVASPFRASHRPLGITLLAVLSVMQAAWGLVMLVLGEIFIVGMGMAYEAENTDEAMGWFALIALVPIGLLALEAYGLWQLHPIAWWAAVVYSLLILVAALRTVATPGSEWVVVYVVPTAVVLIYLWTPQIRQAFTRGSGHVPIPFAREPAVASATSVPLARGTERPVGVALLAALCFMHAWSGLMLVLLLLGLSIDAHEDSETLTKIALVGLAGCGVLALEAYGLWTLHPIAWWLALASSPLMSVMLIGIPLRRIPVDASRSPGVHSSQQLRSLG